MRILVVSQWFPPEPGGGPARFLEMARAWRDAGHEVTVVAGLPNHPTGVVAPGYRHRLRLRERYDGLDVIRTWVYATPNERVVRRIVNHASFLITAQLARTGIRPDVVVATSPPLFAGLAGLLLARRHRCPFVLDVRDLWPDAIFALGQIDRPAVRRALERLERELYRRASAVVVVTPSFSPVVAARGARRVEVIPNGADTSFFTPGPGIRPELGWEGRFVVLYAGTIGLAHGLRSVLDTAVRSPDVTFVLAGEGADKAALQDEVRRRRLGNVSFLPLQPRSRMPDLYRSADVCLVALRPLELFELFIPSKLFEIMACGRPVVAALTGRAAAIVREAGAGVVVPPGDPDALAAAIDTARADPYLTDKGGCGRGYIEQHYERAALAARYLRVLDGLGR